LALEGGYDLPAICDSAQECVKALLGEPITPIPEEELLRTPCGPAVDTLLNTFAIQTPHWPCIKRYITLATCSAVEAASATSMEGKILMRERVESETVSAMASLSMHHARRSSEATVRSNDSESSEASINTSSKSTNNRRSSDMNMNEDAPPGRRDNEEPMEQDEELTK
jgi:histone deacetylase 4/5